MNSYITDDYSDCQVKLRKSNRPEIISQLLSIPPTSSNPPVLQPLVATILQKPAHDSVENVNKFHRVRTSDLICLSSSEDDLETSSLDICDSTEILNNKKNATYLDDLNCASHNFINGIHNNEIVSNYKIEQKAYNGCSLEGEIDIYVKQNNNSNGNLNDTKYKLELKDQIISLKKGNFHRRRVELRDGKINVYIANNLTNSPSNLYKCFKKNSSCPLLTIYCARISSLEAHQVSPQGKYNLVLTTKPPDNISVTFNLPTAQTLYLWVRSIASMVEQFGVLPGALGLDSKVQRIGYVYIKDTLIGEWSLGVACLSADRRLWYWNVRDDLARSRDLRTALRIELKRANGPEGESSSIDAPTNHGGRPNLQTADAATELPIGIHPCSYLVLDFPTLHHPTALTDQPSSPLPCHVYVCCSDSDPETANWYQLLREAVYRNGPGFDEQRLHVMSTDFGPDVPDTADLEEGTGGDGGRVRSVVTDAKLIRYRSIPAVVEKLINFITDYGTETRGIYRLNGSQAKIESLLRAICTSPSDNTQGHGPTPEAALTRERYSEHDAANALKRYLRTLPEALIIEPVLERLKSIRFSPEPVQARSESYGAVLKIGLPAINYVTLRRLLGHLHAVSKAEPLNHMNAQNLGSVFGPSLMAPRNDKSPDFEDYTDTGWYILVVTELITEYPTIFNVSRDESDVEKKIREGLHKMTLAKCARSSRAGEFMIGIYYDNPLESRATVGFEDKQKDLRDCGVAMASGSTCFFTKISSTVTANELKNRALAHFIPTAYVGESTATIPYIDETNSPPASKDFKDRLNDLLQSQLSGRAGKTDEAGNGKMEEGGEAASPLPKPEKFNANDWCLAESVKGGQLSRPLSASELVLDDVILGWTTKFGHATKGSSLDGSVSAASAPKSLGQKLESLVPKVKANRPSLTDRSSKTGPKKFSFGPKAKKGSPGKPGGDRRGQMSQSLFDEDLGDLEGGGILGSTCRDDIAVKDGTTTQRNPEKGNGCEIQEELVVLKLMKDPWVPAITQLGLVPFSVCAELRMSIGGDKRKPQTPYKRYCFEFSRSTLSYYKSAKSGSSAIGEFAIEHMSLYQGIEASRDPPSNLGFTFYYSNSKMGNSTVMDRQGPSYAVICNSKEEFELWINVLFKAKYYTCPTN